MFTEPDLPINWPNGLQAIRVHIYKQELVIAQLTERVKELEESLLPQDAETGEVIAKRRGRPPKFVVEPLAA
jgi:hypothetical protein